jgi:trigger factor
MDFNIEEQGPIKRKMSVTVPTETVETELGELVENLRKQARLKGFRPGKVPKSIVRRMFAAHIEQEIAQKLISEALPQALDKVDQPLASQPALEDSHFEEGQPFTFTVSFEVQPQFEVAGYEGFDLTQEKVNVTDEMVDKKLEDLRQAYANTRSIEAERPLAKGDFAVLDYTAFTEEGPLEGGANPNYQLEVGSGHFNEEFEDALVGLNKNDEKEIPVTFQDDHYNPQLAGQKIRFEVKLTDIKEKILPELNDEFAKDLGREGIDSLESLREKMREDMVATEERRVEADVRDQIRDKLLELVEFEAPDGMLQQELDSMINNMQFNLRRSGLSMEAMGLSEEKMREDYREEAEKRVKVGLILAKIAKDKEIEVTDQDVEDQILTVSKDTGQPPEAIRDIYNKNNLMDSMKDSLLTEKTLKFITDGANIEYTEPTGDSDVEVADNTAE